MELEPLRQTLLPLIDERPAPATEQATEILRNYADAFQRHWLNLMRAKLGLSGEEEEDLALVTTLLEWMRQNEADFTNTFRSLTETPQPDQPLYKQETFRAWLDTWQTRLNRQSQTADEVRQRMSAHNPVIIPRNHQVEEALQSAEKEGDFAKFEHLHRALSRPYDPDPEFEQYRHPPAKGEDIPATYCGT